MNLTGKPLDTAVAPFLIGTDSGELDALVSAGLATDKLDYLPTESVRIFARIRNLTLNQSASGLTAHITVLNPDGSVRWTSSSALSELVAGALKDIEYMLPLSMAPAGAYQAKLDLIDAAGLTLVSDSRVFSVQSSAITGSGLVGTVQTSPKQVPQGDPLLFTFEVANQGNSELTGLPLTVTIIDPAAQQVIASLPYTANLAVGATIQISGQWTSTGTIGTTYLAVLAAQVAGKALTLALDDFSVVAPPIRFTLGAAPRYEASMLALVSCRPGGNESLPEDLSCAIARAQWLSGYLASTGIEHRIVTTAEDFAAELHCGRYNLYWISGGAEKLGATLAKEVREAVRRGHGLLIDGVHDQRNGLLDQIVGVDYRGKLPHTGYTVAVAPPLFPSGASLPSAGIALKYNLAGGIAQASFPGAAGQPAIITRNFGDGRAIAFAFDLVGSLQGFGAWTDPFRTALSHVTPVQPPAYSGKARVPLALSIRNDGQATTMIVTADIPSSLALDGVPQGATLDASGKPVWQVNLTANASRDLILNVRAPALSGQYEVTFHAASRRNGVTTPYADLTAQFNVEASDLIGTRAVTNIQGLAPATSPQRNARNRAAADVQAAVGYLVQGLGGEALSRLLSAADDLATIVSVPVAGIQADVARLVAEAEALQCNALPVCSAVAPRVVNDGLFSPLLPQPELQALGGGEADWEWALGNNIGATGGFVYADLNWVSGKLYDWTLTYDGQNAASLAVRDGTATLLSLAIPTGASNAPQPGTALQLGVSATQDAGTARWEAALVRLKGHAVAGALGTRGDSTYSESQLTYFLPGLANGFTAEGTLRLTFPDAAPPAGNRMRFSIGAGNVSCRP